MRAIGTCERPQVVAYCGEQGPFAWDGTAIAIAYPQVRVDAIDVDATSIEQARANVAAAGLDGRVRPVLHDASAT
jgi:predicted RNA methylase